MQSLNIAFTVDIINCDFLLIDVTFDHKFEYANEISFWGQDVGQLEVNDLIWP